MKIVIDDEELKSLLMDQKNNSKKGTHGLRGKEGIPKHHTHLYPSLIFNNQI